MIMIFHSFSKDTKFIENKHLEKSVLVTC